MAGRQDVVAIVDADADAVSVWWVNVGHRETGPRAKHISRLCGAWSYRSATSDVIERLTYKRVIWSTEPGAQALRTLRVPTHRHLDLGATLELMNADRDQHKEAFEIEQASRTPSKRLQVPDWPRYPEPIDIDQLGHSQSGKSRSIERALAAAQWLDELCSQWESFEETRLSSSWLSELDGPGTRALPVVVSQSDPHS